jgi:hypothetical protein
MAASADIFTTATELAILLAARAPVWTSPALAAFTAAPVDANSGVYLDGAARTDVFVRLREEARRRTARLYIDTVDANATYTVTINGTAVNFVASGSTLEQIVDGLAAAINGNGTLGPLVTATATDTAGSAAGRDHVLIVGDTELDFGIDFTRSGVTAVLRCVADRSRCKVVLWWAMGARPGSTPPSGWVSDGEEYEVMRRGWVQRFDSAGFDRLHVQLLELVGDQGDGTMVTYRDPVVSIGPCLSEVV